MPLVVGDVLNGKVSGITKFGAFVVLPEGKTGMVHISEIAANYVKEIRDHITENQIVKVKVMTISDEGKISLSIKRAMDIPKPDFNNKKRFSHRPGNFEWQEPKHETTSFEDMMSKFKQCSDEKMSDLKHNLDSKRRNCFRRDTGSSK